MRLNQLLKLRPLRDKIRLQKKDASATTVNTAKGDNENLDTA